MLNTNLNPSFSNSLHLVCLYNGFKHQGFLKCFLYQSTQVWFGITCNNFIIFTLELYASSQALQYAVSSQIVWDSQGADSLKGFKASSSLRSAVSWSLWQDQMLLLYMIAESAFLPPTQKAGVDVDVSASICVSLHLHSCRECEVYQQCASTDKWLPSWNII